MLKFNICLNKHKIRGGISISNLYVPVYTAIKKYLDLKPTPFHMPGHKLGKGIPEEFLGNLMSLDLTEIPGTDNLHFPEGAIGEAQGLAAKAFGSDETFFLVNGSTCGLHSMIMTMCKPGDKLIVARDCHKAVIGGMMLAGVTPVYIKPGFDESYGIPTVISTVELEKTLHRNPDAAGVLITRPNYYGICSDIKEIAEVVHSHDKVLAVDEAHGAHLNFNERLPTCAMRAGADICVQSAHKTLPALTQGAYLHVKSNKIDLDILKFNLSMFQTSSPSYIIMAFLDIARAIMEQSGRELLNKLLDNIEWFSNEINKQRSMKLLSKSVLAEGDLDKTRIVINARNSGKTGFGLEKILMGKYNIQVEMSDLYNIVCIATVADQREDFEKLAEALGEVAEDFKHNPPLADTIIRGLEIPEQAVELKDVFRYKVKKVRLNEAVGKVSSGIITPYPPGIPVICPGEIIERDTVEYLIAIIHSGGIVNGMGNNMEMGVIE